MLEKFSKEEITYDALHNYRTDFHQYTLIYKFEEIKNVPGYTAVYASCEELPMPVNDLPGAKMVDTAVLIINPKGWRVSTNIEKEIIIFHELGHCYLNRNHVTEKYCKEKKRKVLCARLCLKLIYPSTVKTPSLT